MPNVRIKKAPRTGEQEDYALVYNNVATSEAKPKEGVKTTMTAVPREQANIEVEGNESVIGDINSYLNTVSYYVNLANIKNNNTENINCYDRGYCIEETTAPVTDGITSKYYKVTTYININFPFFKLNFNIPITGETRKIERINR